MSKYTSQIKERWKNAPRSYDGARKALDKFDCPICGCIILIALRREPIPDWRAHCQCCGSEFFIAVLQNRPAWKKHGETLSDK